MVATLIKGGLGNQMFQYAAAKGLSENYEKVYLDFDFLRENTSSNQDFTAHGFELDVFPNLKYEELLASKRKIFFSGGFLYKILRKINSVKKFVQKENEFVPMQKSKMVYLDGYFQSENYFKEKRSEILNDFHFAKMDAENEDLLKKINETENSVSVHIRRGDYLKESVKKYHGVLSESYYDTAIAEFSEKFSNPVFFIFSDDSDYAEEKYGDMKNFVIVKGNPGKDSWKDINLMKNCKHHIIANSSFSWWGAWLSEKNGETIAPKNWFNPEVVSFDISVIAPPSWKII